MADAEGVVAEEACAALEERARRGVTEDVKLAKQALQERTGVGVHGEVTVHGRLAKLLGVDVVHDHVGVAGPALEIIADLTDVEAGANAENQVCVLYGEVARTVTAATRTADVERVVARDDVRSVPADYNWDVEAMCDLQEERLGARDTDAIARIEDRATARADLFEDELHLLRIHRRHSRLTLRCVGIRRDPVRIFFFPAVATSRVIRRVEADQLVTLDELSLDVDRDVEPARARAAGLAEIDALLERVANAVRIGQHLRILRHAVDGLRDIELLVAHRTEAGAVLLFCPARSVVIADLAGDDQHRDGVEPGAEHAGDGVRAARAGGHAEKRRTVVDAGVALGGHRAGLLVVLVERVHALLVAESVVQVHGTATGHAEVLGDAVGDEGFGNVVRKLDFHYLLLLFVRSGAPRDVVYFIVLVRGERRKGTRWKTREDTRHAPASSIQTAQKPPHAGVDVWRFSSGSVNASLSIWMPDEKLPGAPLLHARQIVLEEAAIYAVASAEVAGVVEEAAAGVVGGFTADVGTEDMDVGVHGEAVEFVPEFGFAHDALVPVGAEHFSREDVLVDGDIDREVERVEELRQLVRCAAIQDVILREAADARAELPFGYEAL